MINKLTNGPISCSLTFSDSFAWYSKVHCPYGEASIRYAVSRFFSHCGRIRRDCTAVCYRLRLKNGRHRKNWFVYVIPAPPMELPGNWVRVCGSMSADGVEITHVAILRDYPEIRS